MERKKGIKKKINKPRQSIIYNTIQLIIVVYHTKFQTSSLHSSWEIFDEKGGVSAYREFI